MMTMAAADLLYLCLVLFGFLVGVVVFFVIRHLLFPEEAYAPKKRLSYTMEERRTLAVLQQLQAMIGAEAATRDPGLADLKRLLGSMQRDFGRNASLEDVIQLLVARDLERQLAARKRRTWELVPAVEVLPTVQQEVVA